MKITEIKHVTLTDEQVHAFRMSRSFLSSNPEVDPLVIASGLFGVQAQVFSAGKLALGIRSGKNESEIDALFAQKNGMIKTWAMRGTLHAFAAKDLPLLSAAIGFDTEVRYIRHWKNNYGVKEADSIKLLQTLESLISITPKTKREFSAEASDSLGEWVKPIIENGWGGAVKSLCNMGIAVFGEQRGQEVTFTRRERYIPKWKTINPENAQDDILRRYLHTYGPASLSDFSYWLGRSIAFVKNIWERVHSELQEVQIGGRKACILRTDTRFIKSLGPISSQFALLPFFDVYLLPHRKKEHLVEDMHYKKIFRAAGWISPSIIHNGRVIGVWKMERSKEKIRITGSPFTKLDRKHKDLLREKAASIGNYFDLKISLRGF